MVRAQEKASTRAAAAHWPLDHSLANPLQHILTLLTLRGPAARLLCPSAAAAEGGGGAPSPLRPPPAWEGHEARGEITAHRAYGKPPLPCAASGDNLIIFLLSSSLGRPPTWRKLPSQPAGCCVSRAQPTPPVVHLCTWGLQPSHPCHVLPLATTSLPAVALAAASRKM